MSKRLDIMSAAAGLFSVQGFEATATQQIAAEAGVTEPLIYYHFKGKDDLFTEILERGFAGYFALLDAIDPEPDDPFQVIEDLIEAHLAFVRDMPSEAGMILHACPARLKDPDGLCRKRYIQSRTRLTELLTGCIELGVASGRFIKVPIRETANLLIALLNGLMRQNLAKMDSAIVSKEQAADFCRRSLLRSQN